MRPPASPANAIRAFEASARHLSFTRAAEELAVTQAAVSQQVRRLEDWLQVKLFRRLEGRLELTQAGHVYVNPLTRRSTNRGCHCAHSGPARGTACCRSARHRPLPANGWCHGSPASWPPTRRSRYGSPPRIGWSISTRRGSTSRSASAPAAGPGRGGREAVRRGGLPGVRPALMAGPHPLTEPQDLQHHTLLHDDSLVHWRYWLRLRGCRRSSGPADPVQRFGASPGCRGGRAGGGAGPAACWRRSTFPSAGWSSRSVWSSANAYGFHVVVKPGALERPAVRAFRDWLVAEAAAMDRHDDGDEVVDFGP